MNRISLLIRLTKEFPELGYEHDLGAHLTVHIQLAAGATGKVAVELYRGLNTGKIEESWGLTLPAHTRDSMYGGMFVFLVARDGGKIEGGWTYDVYTLDHVNSSRAHHTLALTGDGDRMVRLFNTDELYHVGELLLNLPGYTPQGA
jgi:hypothetical protein